jgi:hypothetical protein
VCACGFAPPAGVPLCRSFSPLGLFSYLFYEDGRSCPFGVGASDEVWSSEAACIAQYRFLGPTLGLRDQKLWTQCLGILFYTNR